MQSFKQFIYKMRYGTPVLILHDKKIAEQELKLGSDSLMSSPYGFKELMKPTPSKIKFDSVTDFHKAHPETSHVMDHQLISHYGNHSNFYHIKSLKKYSSSSFSLNHALWEHFKKDQQIPSHFHEEIKTLDESLKAKPLPAGLEKPFINTYSGVRFNPGKKAKQGGRKIVLACIYFNIIVS